MAVCPFARQVPAEVAGGTYVEAPWKIVHHKTIVIAENAHALYSKKRSWPHFTVGPSGIQQHYDTEVSARSLENLSGGVETNRSRAVQIELVAGVGKPAPPESLAHLASLLRWIEETHKVPSVWPSGRPKQPKDDKDPGGHNRDRNNWLTASGHYGHCHVPENAHWDPFYYDEEWAVVGAGADGDDELSEEQRAALGRIDQRAANLEKAMSDLHPEVPHALGRLEERVGRLTKKIELLEIRLKR